MTTPCFVTGILALGLGMIVHLVAGYGYLSFPPATYRDLTRSQIYTTQFNTSIHPMLFGLRHVDPLKRIRRDVRAAHLVNALAFADYLSLREIADVIFPGCGNSIMDADVEPVNVYNASDLLWRNEDEKFGFYPKTVGPCETWIDNERVQYDDNCVSTYKMYPAKIPVDFTHCPRGRVCELRFYWIAVDSAPIKLMKHCVRIVNDPYRPTATENTKPYKNFTATNTTPSFSVDLTITWEQIWLGDDGTLDETNPYNPGSTILVIP